MISIPSSTSIARYGYSPEKDVLTIDFHKTGLYEYYNVTAEEMVKITSSEEKNKALLKLIKNKRFRKLNDSK